MRDYLRVFPCSPSCENTIPMGKAHLGFLFFKNCEMRFKFSPNKNKWIYEAVFHWR
jgi:hypothetical protein